MEEKSCGCIIINDGKVLLVKHNIGHWDFPKGHVEEGETEEKTAKREVKEETNIDVEIDITKRYINEYYTDKGNHKTVVLFVAKKISGEEKNQEEEINEVKWIPVKEAIDLITYNNTKELFKKVLQDL